ncbi:M48 family metalloprotease [Streptomyces sp. KLMMK]|uniref:M48 family metalloprotease n=1 Tax=Streptomyces sp. KLMMK TaxID=3109353 RepID=UPI0030093AAA
MRRTTGWIRDRFWSHIIAAWMLTIAVITQQGSGPHLGLHALPMAVIASWAWALHRASDCRTLVAEGFRAQHHTWNSLLRARPSHAPGPSYSAVIQRMRSTEDHLRAVARKHRLQRLSIAVIDGWDPAGDANEAASVGDGRRAHLWLGSNWFAPDDTIHLPAVLEHELGHILRRDNQRATALQAAGVFLVVLAAAWASWPVALLTAAALRLLYTGWAWHSELACDARAVRTCGRAPVTALWRHNTHLLRTLPTPARLRLSWKSVPTHPPYRLRLWWAQQVSAPSAAIPHPLATLADASGQAPVYVV